MDTLKKLINITQKTYIKAKNLDNEVNRMLKDNKIYNYHFVELSEDGYCLINELTDSKELELTNKVFNAKCDKEIFNLLKKENTV